MRKYIILALLIALVAPWGVRAEVSLPTLIANGMVLQRETANTIWGTAQAGEIVPVTFLDHTYSATASADGTWTLTLPALPAGGPYTMQIGDTTVSDILIGDVWLCAGQSNMELPVSRVMDMFADEVNAYENEYIRQLIVPKTLTFAAPLSALPPAEWKALTAENVMSFSALAYFFAREMYAQTGVPIGIVNASWGGTPVEAWVSAEALAPFPLYINKKALYDDEGYTDRLKRLEGESYARWSAILHANDPGLQEQWYAADYDDSAWDSVDMFATTWGNNGVNPLGGSHWLRKDITLTSEWAAAPATLRLGCIIDADSVYVNGTFVGTTGYQYPPRIYPLAPGLLHEGRNNITIRLISNGGQPSFVPEKPYKLLLGDGSGAEESLEGAWRYHLGTPMPPAPASTFLCYEPTCLYNAMIAPLHALTFKGVIWYQGESNVGRRNEYTSLLTTMIDNWRSTFADATLPFYIVELADFLSPADIHGRRAWAELRAAQAAACQLSTNAYLIKNDDLGEWNDIHPLDKKTLAQRIVQQVLDNEKQ